MLSGPGDEAMSLVSAWSNCSSQLERATSPTTDETQRLHAVLSAVEACTTIQGLGAVPAAKVQELVANMQVALHVCTACSTAAQQYPRSPVVYVAVAAVHLLHTLELQCSDNATAASVRFATTASVWQQMQQSGLPQPLPALMTAAAEELDAQRQQQQQQQQAAQLQQQEQPSGLPVLPPGGTEIKAWYRRCIVDHAAWLLDTAFLFWHEPQPVLQTAVLYAPAALRLMLALQRHISGKVQQLWQPQGRDVEPQHRVVQSTAFDALLQVVEAFIKLCRPLTLDDSACPTDPVLAAQQMKVLMSPDLLSCLSIQTATSLLANQLSFTSHVGSSSAGSRRQNSTQQPQPASSNQQQPQQAAEDPLMSPAQRAWERGCSLLPLLSPCQLKLFDVLGVDAKVVLWVAAARQERFDLEAKLDLAGQIFVAGVDVLLHQLEAVSFEQQQQWFKEQHRQVLPLNLLVTTMSLHTTAAVPRRHPQFLLSCAYAARICANALRSSYLLSVQRPGRGVQLEDALVLQQLLPSWVDEAVPLLLKLMHVLTRHLEKAWAAAEPNGNATSGSSRRSAENDWRDTENAATALTSFMCACCYMVQEVTASTRRSITQIRAAGTPMPSYPAATAAGSESGQQRQAAQQPTSSSPQGTPAVPCRCVWYDVGVSGLLPHTLALLQGFDSYVRLVARYPPSAENRQLVIGSLTKLADISSTLKEHCALVPLLSVSGPGSPVQLQHYSLLCSMEKLAAATKGAVGPDVLGDIRRTIVISALLRFHDSKQWWDIPVADTRGRCCKFNQASSIPREEWSAVHLLPGLAIAGRALLQLAQQLQLEAPALVLLCAQRGAASCGQAAMLAKFLGMGAAFATSNFFLAERSERHPVAPSALRSSLTSCRGWLSRADVHRELSVAGYDVAALQGELTQLWEAMLAAAGSKTEATLLVLVQQLRSAGLVLTSLPMSVACNNPWCDNLSGPSEWELVCGRSCRCAGCHTARYCGRACQRQHWKQHKPVCKRLAAAAAAAAAAAGAVDAST